MSTLKKIGIGIGILIVFSVLQTVTRWAIHSLMSINWALGLCVFPIVVIAAALGVVLLVAYIVDRRLT